MTLRCQLLPLHPLAGRAGVLTKRKRLGGMRVARCSCRSPRALGSRDGKCGMPCASNALPFKCPAAACLRPSDWRALMVLLSRLGLRTRGAFVDEDVSPLTHVRGCVLPRQLVDEIGNIDDAIAKAVELAALESYKLTYYPEVKDPIEELLKKLDNTTPEEQLVNKIREFAAQPRVMALTPEVIIQ